MAISRNAAPPVGHARTGPASGPPRSRCGLWLATAVLLVLTIDAASCGLALITPVSAFYLDAMRLAGALFGVVLARAMMDGDTGRERLSNRIVLWIVVPVASGYAFDAIAWRAAERWTFVRAPAVWEEGRFPILAIAHSSSGGASDLIIDPYQLGENTRVPIPRDQYRDLTARGHAGLCVTLPLRRAGSGAIEVRTRPGYSWSGPAAATVGPCPGAESSPGGTERRDPANPWV